ncbi:APC family permease, partial [Salinibacter ruber]|uniref:APC family permease n=1 Tax=Salinibacter ruber TaxID=146919 RepID=UPI0021A5F7FC
VSLFDHRIDQAGGPDATQFKQKDSLLVEPLPFFVSRALGTLLGCMVGIGQWLGLIFASAFYLIGFGHYLSDLVRELGINLPLPVVGLALGMGILLTGVSVTGTENTGDLQNWIVGSLLAILAGFLGHGGLDALGVFGRQQTPEAFFPYGTMPVLTTAALVFTSYLGFVQIATVAGEIKAPSRNLPRSMIGSVLLVGTLYVLTIFISTSLLGSEQLAEMGETAVVNVGRSIAGTFGAAALLGGGLLATLSSANASILSASRSIYALSRDDLVPSQVERINRRYRTPHVALLLTGGIIVALILFGRVEVLAEVASLLHLFMYGLICVALLVLRQSPPDGYQPSFRCPGYPVVPVLGALTSFGLVAFMNLLSIAIGGGILLVTAVWYLYYARAVTISEISS